MSRVDPGGLGDGARVLARDTRLRPVARAPRPRAGDDGDLVDPVAGIEACAGRPAT